MGFDRHSALATHKKKYHAAKASIMVPPRIRKQDETSGIYQQQQPLQQGPIMQQSMNNQPPFGNPLDGIEVSSGEYLFMMWYTNILESGGFDLGLRSGDETALENFDFNAFLQKSYDDDVNSQLDFYNAI
jgi:hypothetical protein